MKRVGETWKGRRDVGSTEYWTFPFVSPRDFPDQILATKEGVRKPIICVSMTSSRIARLYSINFSENGL